MLDLIFLAIIALAIASKLFKLLGKTDDEFIIRRDQKLREAKNSKSQSSNKFKADIDIVSAAEAALPQNIRDVFDKIRKIDPDFHVDQFYVGAKSAFNMIIKAFADNDKETLKKLLSTNVYKNFTSSIDSRIANKHSLDKSVVGINNLEVIEASLSGSIATVVVDIVSDQITVLKDHLGNTLDGNKDMVVTNQDTWTFTRNVQKDKIWLLTETRAI